MTLSEYVGPLGGWRLPSSLFPTSPFLFMTRMSYPPPPFPPNSYASTYVSPPFFNLSSNFISPLIYLVVIRAHRNLTPSLTTNGGYSNLVYGSATDCGPLEGRIRLHLSSIHEILIQKFGGCRSEAAIGLMPTDLSGSHVPLAVLL